MTRYKPGDIVLTKSCAGPAIPPVHVELIKRTHVKAKKGNRIDWPEYVTWDAILVYPEEAKMLRKEWSIPFKFPDDIKTCVFESSIIKLVKRKNTKTTRRRKAKKKQSTE